MNEVLAEKLEHGLIDPRVLLSSAKMLDETSRRSPAYDDPKYLSFYYALGEFKRPKKVIQIGSKMGLIGHCLCQGAKTVERWVAYDTPETAPPARVTHANLRAHCPVAQVTLTTEGFTETGFDMAILSGDYGDETLGFLNLLWDRISGGGLLVADYIHDDAVGCFSQFSKGKNREPFYFRTRYGVGILTR